MAAALQIAAAFQIWLMRLCLAALMLLCAAALLDFARRHARRAVRRVGWGIVGLAIAALAFGGNKPQPQPKKEELVIIIEPLDDGMYSTRALHISKEELNEIKNSL